MLTPPQVVKQELLQKIDDLPDYKLQEVLDFIEFLLFKSEASSQQSTGTTYAQKDILAGLTQIRETVYRDYGVYQGDLVAEARAEREQ